MMKYVFYILSLSLFFFSCKTQKTLVTEKVNQDTTIETDISLNDYKHIIETSNQDIEQWIQDQIQVTVKTVQYDTEKPIDPVTGKHPVKQEKEVNVNRQKEAHTKDSISGQKQIQTEKKITDQTQVTQSIQTETKEEKRTGLQPWQKVLMVVGASTVVVFILYSVNKIK